jgi:hypothetical protein
MCALGVWYALCAGAGRVCVYVYVGMWDVVNGLCYWCVFSSVYVVCLLYACVIGLRMDKCM